MSDSVPNGQPEVTGARQGHPGLVLFDLDGTLSDSAGGIVASMRRAFVKEGVAVPDEAQLRTFVGPPLASVLEDMGFDAASVGALVQAYRADYNAGGLFESSVYLGVHEMLAQIAATGARIGVATSKPQPTARRIVEHFGLDEHLTGGLAAVFGSDPERIAETKADVIARALAAFGTSAPDQVVMVGDRHHDVDGARAHGVDCVGVGWGYAPDGELLAAGAVAVVETRGALVEFLKDRFGCDTLHS